MIADAFKPFVFIDDFGRPLRVQLRGTVPWLFYWHQSKQWVPVRALPLASEVEQLRGKAVPDAEADLFEQEIRKHHPNMKEVA